MIYLDANATSQLRPEARAMIEELTSSSTKLFNPSSVHQGGRTTHALIEQAREYLRELLSPARSSGEEASGKVIFTSGGTESCNAMIFGFLPSDMRSGHLVGTSIEHPAVLEPLKALERQGLRLTLVDPNPEGFIEPEAVWKAVTPETALVTVMAANNETGALQPVEEIAALLRKNGYKGVIVSDTIQALGKSVISAKRFFTAGVDAISLSGHKIGAPTGIGALVLAEGNDRCFPFQPLILGGPQEGRLRAGTENIIGILALGTVANKIRETLVEDVDRMAALRCYFYAMLKTAIPGIRSLTSLSSSATVERHALSNTLLLQIPGCRGDDLVVALDLHGICASTGSACASGKQEASHVVRAQGLEGDAAREVIRFSLDWDSSEAQLYTAAEIIKNVVTEMRQWTTPKESLSL